MSDGLTWHQNKQSKKNWKEIVIHSKVACSNKEKICITKFMLKALRMIWCQSGLAWSWENDETMSGPLFSWLMCSQEPKCSGEINSSLLLDLCRCATAIKMWHSEYLVIPTSSGILTGLMASLLLLYSFFLCPNLEPHWFYMNSLWPMTFSNQLSNYSFLPNSETTS